VESTGVRGNFIHNLRHRVCVGNTAASSVIAAKRSSALSAVRTFAYDLRMGTIEPGWYDDGSGRQRWWDGTAWGEHYVDMSGSTVELQTSTPGIVAAQVAGWYNDGRGRLRWWDGHRWGAQTQIPAGARSFAGVSLAGDWIHYADLSQPVSGVMASFESGRDIGGKATLTRAAARGSLFGPTGQLTEATFAKRIDRRRLYLAIDGPEQFWIVPADGARTAQAAAFVADVNDAARHYRRR